MISISSSMTMWVDWAATPLSSEKKNVSIRIRFRAVLRIKQQVKSDVISNVLNGTAIPKYSKLWLVKKTFFTFSYSCCVPLCLLRIGFVYSLSFVFIIIAVTYDHRGGTGIYWWCLTFHIDIRCNYTTCKNTVSLIIGHSQLPIINYRTSPTIKRYFFAILF